MDHGGERGGGRSATGLSCASCGTELPPHSKFCNECGARVTQFSRSAEYKQVTVLFADVVHSMDIAKAVGAERLREIMAGLLDRATAVVTRYEGTVDKFTGDGIMAVFGAPVALEDHAVRACRAALEIHNAIAGLAEEVSRRDGIELQLRIGLNSGQVIAGEIGSGGAGYTAIGEQVGLAQRMESIAPPGGVMLSAYTARLVETVASLGDPELVHIKGSDQPVTAQRLLGLPDRDRRVLGGESALVGRRWEMGAVEGLLQRAIDGHGAVVTVVGSPGIGKSRLVREVTALAAARGVEVFTAVCESHTTQVPFHAVARLLRAATGVQGLDGPAARAQVRAQTPEADPEDLLLFEDLLGIADPEVELPKIDPDARRRRLTALVNTASLARRSPAVYVIEDAHWIDDVSESMLAERLSVIPPTPSLVLVTYRPEYRGALSQVQGAQTIALAPLRDSEIATLVGELVGPDPSVAGLSTLIVERASGNPFFAHEMVRDLAERGVLQGQAGGYISTADAAEVSLPATVQATIAARIDRLDQTAKSVLTAAAVIGSKFSRDLLAALGINPVFEDLVGAEFIDQVPFTPHPEFAFHHPLIRTVAYESQLKSDRAELHRRVAAAVETTDPSAADENAALIAEHLQAAGDLRPAFGWHMRAGAWLAKRDIGAARLSWDRARQVADALTTDDPDRTAMGIASRTLLCGSAWRVNASISDHFEELHRLCAETGDKASLIVAMAGLAMDHIVHDRPREASQVTSEYMTFVDSIGDPTLTVRVTPAALHAKYETGERADALRWAQKVIDLVDGDTIGATSDMGSPLAAALVARGIARFSLGLAGWRKDFDRAVSTARGTDPMSHAAIVNAIYGPAIGEGVLLPDDDVLRDIEEALQIAERAADDVALGSARLAQGLALVQRGEPNSERGFEILSQVREMCLQRRFPLTVIPVLDLAAARQMTVRGDDAAVPRLRAATDQLFERGHPALMAATEVLVQALLARRADADVLEAQGAIDRFAGCPAGDLVTGQVLLLRLRALLAQAQGNDTAYRDYRDRYRKMANDLGFEGHMARAEEMP